MDSGDPRSIVDLISTLTADLANLVRKESELIRAELSEKLSQSMAAARMLGIGAALLLGAFLVLLQGRRPRALEDHGSPLGLCRRGRRDRGTWIAPDQERRRKGQRWRR